MKMKATVAYDGSGFHGFAVNPGVRTVAGDIEAALERVVGESVTLTCSGRTDKGVHGRGQIISFELPDDAPDPSRIESSINGLCKPSIVVRDVMVVDDDFDARFSATYRRYRYSVLNATHADPLRANTAWHVWQQPLDLYAMNSAAAHLVGEQDFASFCKRVKVADGEPEKSTVRNVLSAEWRAADDDVIEFWVQATAFCHQMVRSFVGTCVDVGLGRLEADAIPDILAAKDRTAAGQVAPPHGLTFWEVGY